MLQLLVVVVKVSIFNLGAHMIKKTLLVTAIAMSAVTSTFAENRKAVVDCNKYKKDEVMCTACNVYHEARNEPIAGQIAVALVTRNRVNSNLYPDTFCEVVWETRRSRRTKKQVPMFSWTLDGKADKIYNESVWRQSIIVASIIHSAHLNNGYYDNTKIVDITHGALWYHADFVQPHWRTGYYRTAKIGAHIFYTKNEKAYLSTLYDTNVQGELRKVLFQK